MPSMRGEQTRRRFRCSMSPSRHSFHFPSPDDILSRVGARYACRFRLPAFAAPPCASLCRRGQVMRFAAFLPTASTRVYARAFVRRREQVDPDMSPLLTLMPPFHAHGVAPQGTCPPARQSRLFEASAACLRLSPWRQVTDRRHSPPLNSVRPPPAVRRQR